MLEFKTLNIDNFKELLPYIKQNEAQSSDISAGYLYMWGLDGDACFCIEDDTLVVCQKIGEQFAFSYPIGKNVQIMITKIKEYVIYHNLALRFYAIEDKMLDIFIDNKNIGNIMYAYDPKWSDYLYSFEELFDFKGKKFSGQRNHINKFNKLYPNHYVRLLNKDDIDIVDKLLCDYKEEHQDVNELEKIELEKSKELFKVVDELDLISAGLFIDNKLVALSIGEIINNSLIVHVEKGLVKYDGVYPKMFSSLMHIVKDLGYQLEYINREDDSGDLGLRTSKLQYHPINLINKYLVHVNSPALKINNGFFIKDENIVLTRFRKSDKEEYLKLNIDEENNKYWGYNYLDDIYITNVDIDTFYESLIYDEKAGDSINFAIRLGENDKLIGEVILYNFTINNDAELGCRISKEFQGYGYGKKAFKLIANYASSIGLNVYSKCYKENIASFKMITSSGFIKYKEDDKFYYFKKN